MVWVINGDEPNPGPGTAPGQVVGGDVPGGQVAGVVGDRELATKILPDLDSVPTGWVLQEGMPAESKCPPECQDGLVSVKTAYYPDRDADYVWMDVHTFGSVEAAVASYAAVGQRLDTVAELWATKLEQEQTTPSPGEPTVQSRGGSTAQQSPISLQGLGADEYEAVTWSVTFGRGVYATEHAGVSVVLRVGTVVANVEIMDEEAIGAPDSNLLQALARAVVERAQQAQRGETPTALVHSR